MLKRHGLYELARAVGDANLAHKAQELFQSEQYTASEAVRVALGRSSGAEKNVIDDLTASFGSMKLLDQRGGRRRGAAGVGKGLAEKNDAGVESLDRGLPSQSQQKQQQRHYHHQNTQSLNKLRNQSVSTKKLKKNTKKVRYTKNRYDTFG